jgi:hypothetical protein
MPVRNPPGIAKERRSVRAASERFTDYEDRPGPRIALDWWVMSQSILQRRLVDVSERLKRIRAELAVTEEQLLFLEEEAERQRMRALVAETPLADVEARDSRRHADALARHRDSLSATVRELVQEQDSLLDRISAELSAR